MSFSTRLKERREQLGITQVELARQLNITKGAVGNYETGFSSPKAEILYKVFDVLKCDANFLFQDEMQVDTEQIQATSDEADIIKNYRLLDERGKAVVLDVMLRELQYTNKKEIDAVEIIDTLKNISNKVNSVNTMREGIKK